MCILVVLFASLACMHTWRKLQCLNPSLQVSCDSYCWTCNIAQCAGFSLVPSVSVRGVWYNIPGLLLLRAIEPWITLLCISLVPNLSSLTPAAHSLSACNCWIMLLANYAMQRAEGFVLERALVILARLWSSFLLFKISNPISNYGK